MLNTNEIQISNGLFMDRGEDLIIDLQVIDGLETEKFGSGALGLSGLDFMNQTFANDEAILFGVRRGQVGSLIAATHIGKTLLLLNLTLIVAVGGIYKPFIDKANEKGLRIIFVDGESSKGELKFLLERMMKDWSVQDREKAMRNCHFVCDVEIDDETLNLSKGQHFKRIESDALAFKPDLIIIDPVTALFDIENENDNAKVKSQIMKPLKNLARKVNTAVFYSHHIGKMNEDANTATKAYGGRGGSAFGGLSRTVISLTADKHDKDKRIFSMPKIKGKPIDDTILKLNGNTLWFNATNELPPQIETSYSQTLGLVEKEMATSEIVKNGEKIGLSKSTIEKNLKDAVLGGDIQNTRRGFYAPIDSVTSVTSIANTEITETS